MVKKGSIFLFCIPGKIYKGKPIEEVAKLYTKMAIKDYDSMITFDPTYDEYKEKSDVHEFVFEKSGMKIFRNLFLYQPMTRVGGIYGFVNCSSHLFNPKSPFKNLLLPDLDVVEFHERKRGQANEIKNFYESYGWVVEEYDNPIEKSILRAKKGRFANAPYIISAKNILNVAEENFGYDSKKLCWT